MTKARERLLSVFIYSRSYRNEVLDAWRFNQIKRVSAQWHLLKDVILAQAGILQRLEANVYEIPAFTRMTQ